MDVPGRDLGSGIRAAKNIGGVLLLRSLSRASGLVLLFFAVRFNAQPSSLCLGSDRHCELFLFLSKFDNPLFFIWCNMVKYCSTFNSVNALG